MCVIVVKCKGSDFAPLDAIEKCIRQNPDGFSMAWNENGELKTWKSMDPAEAKAKYKELTETLDPAETALLFHARIATHGSNRIENCHCWTHGNIAFAHNGILPIDNRDDMTDSETFFRDLFVPAMEGCGLEFALRMSKAFIARSNNKLAVIDNEGHISLVSGTCMYTKMQFPGLRGKIYFSNTNWFPASTFTTGLGFNPYKDVPKAITGQKKSAPPVAASTNHSSLPAQRKQIGPKNPVSVRRDEARTISESIASIFGPKPFI